MMQMSAHTEQRVPGPGISHPYDGRGDWNIGNSSYSFGKIPLHADGTRDSHTSRPIQTILSTAARGVAGSGQSLPYRDRIQAAFGRHSLDPIRAHSDTQSRAASRAIGARAYASGERIAFAQSPDLRTAAHEAAHVIQQRAGRRPAGNLSHAGDTLERHANAVADRVCEGHSAESLLNKLPFLGSATSGNHSPAVQRAALPASDFGTFTMAKYDKLGPLNGEYGIDMELDFDPDATKVNAKNIGLVQTVHSKLGSKDTQLFPVEKQRAVTDGDAKGTQIDRYGGGKYGNPLYPTDAPAAADKLETTATVPEWGQHAFNYKEGDTPKHQIGKLIDKPTLPGRGVNSGQQFETTALAVEGTQAGTYMGSVTWGWRTDGHGNFIQDPPSLKSKGKPSDNFKAAAKQWNKSSVGGTVRTSADPTNVYDNSYAVAETVAKGTKVEVTDAAPIHDDLTYDDVTIKEGPKVGHTGRIKVNDMQESGGTAAIKLPTP